MNKQAAIYARVSTDDQAERGYSLPSQIEACERFANQKCFDIAAVYQDDISGAKPISARPAGCELQMAIDSRQVQVVIVYQVDRLSRDIVDLLTSVRGWLRAGIEIYALDIGQITSELDIVLVIKGWQGGDERQKIRERTMRGTRAKAKAGKVVGVGSPPYGYSYVDGELFIDESQAEIVRMIFDWYINGDQYGRMMNLVAIADRLTKMGIPTPSDTRGWHRKHGKNEGWYYGVIRSILVSETYCGVLHFGKFSGANGNGGKRPLEEHILIDVPAIVSRQTWELAQARRAFNSRMSRRRMKREYLLRGLIYCGCGGGMAGTSGRYCCARRYNMRIIDSACTERSVKGKTIEAITWDYIMRLIKNPVEFEEKLRQAQDKEATTIQPKQKELEHVIALLEETEVEAEEIARAIRKARGIIAAKLQHQADEADRRYEALSARKIELEESLSFELSDGMIDGLMQFREAVAAGLENPTFEDKRRWLEILQTTVTVKEGTAVVTCRLGGNSMNYRLTEFQIQHNLYTGF